MKHIYTLFVFIGLLLLSSCTSKRLVNKAEKFDDAGLYTDAAGLYYKSLVANSNNIDARLGLQRTGQLVFDDKIEAFKAKYANSTVKEAVYAYREAESYYQSLAKLGVKLITPEEQKVYYQEVKDKYLNDIYGQARKAIGLEEFASAEGLFSEILKIEPTYKDTKSQWITAKYEPIYRRGNTLFNTELYRSAYKDFDIINKGTEGYKNSIQLQQAALNNARLTIAFLPVYTPSSSKRTAALQCQQKIYNGIQGIKSPFYKTLSGESIHSIHGWDNIRDQDMAIQLAKKLGHEFEAKSIFKSELIKHSKYQGRLSKKEKRAYLKRTISVTNPETNLKEQKVVYDKVRYYEYQQKNQLIMELNYALVRVDRDEMALANSFYSDRADEVHYARFDGDYKNLVPGYWRSSTKDSDEDKIYDDATSISRLHQKFKSKSELKTVSQLEKEAFDACAKQIAQHISEYQPEN